MLLSCFINLTHAPCGRLSSQRAGQERSASYPSAAHEKLAHVSRKYSWDKSGRLVGLKDHQRGGSNYQYDPRDQINRITRKTGINKQTEEQYSYDSLMNLGSSNGQLHQYENGTIRTIGQSSYRHDMRGRVVEKRVVKNGFRPKTWHYLWDDFDRLTETHTPDGAIWRYAYDAFGRRIRKECVKPGEFGREQSVTYVWQGATLAEEWKTNTEGDDQPIEVSRWHFEPGTFNPIAKETRKYENESTTNQFYPIVTDHLGTPKELFDTNGNCVWQAEHELWGRTEVTFAKKADNYLPIVDCNLRFQNQWEDTETGLYYNLNRYYDPDSGQYLSTDPIGLEGGLRTHGYVHDPMQWVDPWGLAGCPEKTYQTYTKTNSKTGKVYSGRTSGTGTPRQNVARRDTNHHMNEEGYGPAALDKSSSNSAAIRGREQQLIKANGGAQSTGGTSGNKINGVSSTNKKGTYYENQANQEF